MPPLSIAVVLLAAVVCSAVPGAATGAGAGSEPPLTAIVASGAAATAAVLADGGRRVELSAPGPRDADPAVSPDGRRLAFVSARDGDEEVYVSGPGTGDPRRLTRNGVPDLRPAWSPDGRWIVWQSGPAGAADLRVMRADGSGKRLLVGGPGDDAEPAWSPDGQRIAFTSNRSGRRQLWVVSADGGEPEQLADVPGRTRSPAWSPGGLRLAFAREQAGDADLWTLDLTSGAILQVTRGPGWDSHPDWAPTAERIAFARAEAGRSSLWVVTGAGASPERVPGTVGLADPDWALTHAELVPRPEELLPDLDQRAPTGLVVVRSGGRFRLGFTSSTVNRGRGPLVINGLRSSPSEMTADQVVELAGGKTRLRRDVGRLHFELHEPHYHWHFERFVAYELRRIDGQGLVRRDRKRGFCLLDRWGRVSPAVVASGEPRFVDDCGAGRPDARRVVQGTSVGYVDRYPASFHGQDVDVTGLPAGRYLLVHRVNPDHALREPTYSNNAASVVLRLTWPKGPSAAPLVSVLRRCERSAECPSP